MEEERIKNIEKMKERYLPMDFAAIKEHERSFLVNAYMKKQQREAELKNKMKSLEQAYKPQLSQANLSKAYQHVKEEYAANRKAPLQAKRIAESLESRERIKKYNEKLRALNSLEDRYKPDLGTGQHSQSKMQTSTAGLGSRSETDYGRFGKEWNRKLHRHEDEMRQLEAIKEVGMEYLNYGKSKAGRKDDKTVDDKAAEEIEAKKKEAHKAQEIGKEYLKFAKSKAAKNKDGVSEIAPLINHNISKELKGDEKAYVKARLDKMDSDVQMIEAKVRNKMISKDSIEIENAYLKNIKAKLSILEEL
jgi:hypothetical protein